MSRGGGRGGYGPPTAYTGADVAALFTALARARGRSTSTPSAIVVKGRIEWNGQERGTRKIKFEDLGAAGMARLVAAVDAAKAAQDKAHQAAPARTYTAKSAPARTRQLLATRAGREALAGVATPRTIRAWAAGTRQPSKANTERIASAYRSTATRGVLATRGAAEAARERVADELTDVLKERYDDQEIRLRDIIELRFE